MSAMRILPLLMLTAIPVLAADTVQTERGKLAGAQGKSPDVRVYKGIPYAAPPVGNLRWVPPARMRSGPTCGRR